MPTYNFRNKKTGERWEAFMYISEVDDYLKDNPDVEQELNTFSGIGDPYRMGMRKPDDTFRDLLKEMKTKHPGSTINTF